MAKKESTPNKEQKKERSTLSRLLGGVALVAAGIIGLNFISHSIGNLTHRPR